MVLNCGPGYYLRLELWICGLGEELELFLLGFEGTLVPPLQHADLFDGLVQHSTSAVE